MYRSDFHIWHMRSQSQMLDTINFREAKVKGQGQILVLKMCVW